MFTWIILIHIIIKTSRISSVLATHDLRDSALSIQNQKQFVFYNKSSQFLISLLESLE